MRQALTTTPTALASIVIGTNYTMQNRIASKVVYVEVVAAAPTDSGGAFVMTPAPGAGFGRDREG